MFFIEKEWKTSYGCLTFIFSVKNCFYDNSGLKAFLFSCDNEFLLAKLKFTVCLIQYRSSSVLNETLSRHYFP